MPKLWFKAKTYGYGWYPATWEGWVVILIYLLVVIGLAIVMGNRLQSLKDFIFYFAALAAATIVLLFICVKKGEKARWRWGK